VANLVKPWIVRYVDAEGRRVSSDTPGAKRVEERSKKWYGQGVPGWPSKKRVPLATHKATAQALLNRMVEDALRGNAGLTDRYKDHRALPIADHLADYRVALESKGNTLRYVRHIVRQIETLCDACDFKRLDDIEAGRVLDWLADLRKDRIPPALPPAAESYSPGQVGALLGGITLEAVRKLANHHGLKATGDGKKRRYPRAAVETLLALSCRGASVQTTNYYLTALKGFGRWLVRDRRLPESPVAHLQGGNAKLDRRHDRRELAPAELLAVLDHTRKTGKDFRGLTGADRYHLYLCACGTGFRSGELAALMPESFDFSGDVGNATLPATAAKNRKRATQPMPPAVGAALREYVRGKPLGEPVWPGSWHERAADMLRLDLEAVGVPYSVEGPDGPLFADFHALRHTYVSMLARSGVTVKQAQKLARHSTPELTIGRYAHAELLELGEAVGRMPSLVAAVGPTDNPVRMVSIPEDDYLALQAMAGTFLVLQGALLDKPLDLVAPPVAPTFAPSGNGLGRPETGRQKAGRKAG
jgi:integrase